MTWIHRQRLLLACLLAAGVGMILACGGVVPEKPDVLWDRGDKAEAVRQYKKDYEGWFVTSSEKEKMLLRIVDFEAKSGHTDEAKTWIKRGLDDGRKVEYTEPAAKELVAAVEKEREEARVKKEAEAKEARAKADAEAKRKAEEDAKLKAIEDAKPKPSRANYNKIQNGMTLAQVQAILGPGKESASGPGILIATWQSDAGPFGQVTVISVTFQNGFVESKAIAP